MQKQADLFDPDVNPFEDAEPAAEPDIQVADQEEPEQQVAPLAAPCGFMNCRNLPCRRLASRLLLLDGKPFAHRGVPMLQCEPACWRDVDPDQASGAIDSQGDTGDYPADRDDPGPEAPPDYADWSGWERVDDDGFGAGDGGREEGEG